MEDHLKLIYSYNPFYTTLNPNTISLKRLTILPTTTTTTQATTARTIIKMNSTSSPIITNLAQGDILKVLVIICLVLLVIYLLFFTSDRMMKWWLHIRLQYKRRRNEQTLTVGVSHISVPTVSAAVSQSTFGSTYHNQSPSNNSNQQTFISSQTPTIYNNQQTSLPFQSQAINNNQQTFIPLQTQVINNSQLALMPHQSSGSLDSIETKKKNAMTQTDVDHGRSFAALREAINSIKPHDKRNTIILES
jgi:hypothetical protein